MAILGAIIKRALTLGDKVQKTRLSNYALQSKALRKLLRDAQFTEFGKFYHFDAILASRDIVAEFRKRVPTLDYNTIYDKWWKQGVEEKKDNITWHSKIEYYALSSGTSGAPSKYIPVSKEMLRAMRRAGLKMYFSLAKMDLEEEFFSKEMLMIGGSSDLADNGSYRAGDLSGINASKPPIWLKKKYKPGSEIAKIADWNERIKVIAELADQWDVGIITGIPSWVQLTIEKIVAHHKLDNIHQLWPNLKIYISGGIAFEPYRKSFERLMGAPMMYLDSYLASEGFIAFQNRLDTHSMALLMNNGIFFEFVPFTSDNFDEDGGIKPNAKAFHIGQVKEGIDYAMLMTTCAGSWRYLIGDTVRFTDVIRGEIIITGRTKHFLSICGEHLSVDNMNAGIQKAQDVLDITIPEYTVFGVRADNHFRHKWYIGCHDYVDKQKLIALIDQHLKDINDDYRTERGSVLRNPEIEIVPPSMFVQWLQHEGRSEGQSKFPRVLKGEQFEKWENFVMAHAK